MSGELDTLRGPSWKPGTVAITALLAPLSALDEPIPPAVWLVLVRAAGLLALALAALLAVRIARALGARSAQSAWLAGALAAGLVALSPEWLRYLAHGNEIPIALALALGSIERQLAGHPRSAFVLGAGLLLLRPELAPFVVIHGVWLCWRRPAACPLVMATGLAVATLWVVPEWLGSGDPLGAFRQAAGRPSWSLAANDQPWLAALERAHHLAGPAVEAGLLAALGLWLTRRPRPPWPLLVVPPAAVALVVASTEAGLSGNERYFALPLGLASVLAAAALGALASARPRTWLLAAGGAAGAAAVVLGVALHAARLPAAAREISSVAALHRELERVELSLPPGVKPAVNRPFHTHMAWMTRLSITAVERGGRPKVVVAAPAGLAGLLGDRARCGLAHTRPVEQVGRWRVRTAPAMFSPMAARARLRAPSGAAPPAGCRRSARTAWPGSGRSDRS